MYYYTISEREREREREREKQSSSLLYRFIKVIVIFAYIPQKSRVKVVLSRFALSFFFLHYSALKNFNTLNKENEKRARQKT